MSSLRTLRQGFRWGHPRALPASAVPHLPAPTPSREPSTDWARTPPARAVRSVVQAAGLAPLVRAEVRLTVSGLERLTALGDQPTVLVLNHNSHLDTAALLTALPPSLRARTVVAAAADYFFASWWKAAGTALAFGTVPIERRGGAPSQTPARLLREGWNVVVFPEGTRSPDGWTGRFRLGAAQLALDAGAPLVPVAVRGSWAAMPRGRSWPTPGRPHVSLVVGDPLRPRSDEDARALTARAQAEVERLLDEDATDWWSSLRRAAAGDPPALAAPAPTSWRRTWESSRPVGPRAPARRPVWR